MYYIECIIMIICLAILVTISIETISKLYRIAIVENKTKEFKIKAVLIGICLVSFLVLSECCYIIYNEAEAILMLLIVYAIIFGIIITMGIFKATSHYNEIDKRNENNEENIDQADENVNTESSPWISAIITCIIIAFVLVVLIFMIVGNIANNYEVIPYFTNTIIE